MKKCIFLVVIFLGGVTVFPEDNSSSDYIYSYKMIDENDTEEIFNTLKLLIARFSHYQVDIRKAEEGAEDYAFLAIVKDPGKQSYHANDGELVRGGVYICYFYLNGRKLIIYFAEKGIYGLTQEYSPDDADKVFGRILQHYTLNMKSKKL